jgi:hypothetical protein
MGLTGRGMRGQRRAQHAAAAACSTHASQCLGAPALRHVHQKALCSLRNLLHVCAESSTCGPHTRVRTCGGLWTVIGSPLQYCACARMQRATTPVASYLCHCLPRRAWALEQASMMLPGYEAGELWGVHACMRPHAQGAVPRAHAPAIQCRPWPSVLCSACRVPSLPR